MTTVVAECTYKLYNIRPNAVCQQQALFVNSRLYHYHVSQNTQQVSRASAMKRAAKGRRRMYSAR